MSGLKPGWICSVVMGLAAAAAVCPAAEPIVTLSIVEEAGVDRVNEPVTMGVPLPEGRVRGASDLALTDESGRAIPAQFTQITRWPRDKSIKWVHATFLYSIPAKATRRVHVVPAGRTASEAKVLTAAQAGDVVTVVTGPLKFTVRGERFSGFHRAWLNPSYPARASADDWVQVVDAESMGAGGSVVDADGHHVTGLFGIGKVEIEESGPMRVVVKASGSHFDHEGHKALGYVVRFYAYAGSPVVRVSHTFVNRQGTKPADHVAAHKIAFQVPTALGTGTVTVGGEDKPHSFRAEGWITQVSSDKYTIAGAGGGEPVAGKGKSTKPLTTGWIDLTGDRAGLAMGVRWFWQMYPKRLAVDAKGYMTADLYTVVEDADAPAWVKGPWDVYMGQSRTHYLTFLFHDKKTQPADLQRFFAASQLPLRAFAPGRYYCRDTHCFGWVAESDAALFADKWAKVEAYDAKLKKSIRRITAKLDGHKYGLTRDSYGFYTWGDTFHWGAWQGFGKSPKQTPEWMFSYAGNYYDYPNAALMQFLRTGDREYWHRFEPNAIHVGDVFTCHYHPNEALWGACRYCPPRNHVGLDNGAPYVSAEFNHNKSQCVFAYYYLTGDLRTLDNVKLLMNNAYSNRAADRGWAARGVGAQIAVLYCAYELTMQQKYLDRMKGLVDNALRYWRRGRYPKGGRFMWGIANEGITYYYWLTGDKEVIDGLRQGLDAYGDRAANYANMALGNAMVYHATGEQKYADLAWKALGRGGETSRPKSFGLQWRNTPFALFFLSKAAKDFKPARP
jgi:hypothetical protein